jgi:hypothetical protein
MIEQLLEVLAGDDWDEIEKVRSRMHVFRDKLTFMVDDDTGRDGSVIGGS